MVGIFERCLVEAKVFKRDVPNKSLFDWIEKVETDSSRWAVLVAGVPDDTAERYFKPGSCQAEDATLTPGTALPTAPPMRPPPRGPEDGRDLRRTTSG